MMAKRTLEIVSAIFLITVSAACAPKKVVVEPPRSEVVDIPIVVSPKEGKAVETGKNIVIANIEGSCSQEVKDALMQRLIDNTNYNVLTRDNLDQILVESGRVWGGEFNTETVAKIGQLLGASLFIVGRVAYCGPLPLAAAEEAKESGAEKNKGRPKEGVSIIALLQILDLETGKVLVSAATEGKYEPSSSARVVSEDSPGTRLRSLFLRAASSGSEKESLNGEQHEVSNTGGAAGKEAKQTEFNGSQGMGQDSNQNAMKIRRQDEVDNLPIMRAAEDMANSFADKFFARPVWEEVAMWRNPDWHYGDSIRYVKLGRCPQAIDLLDNVAKQELRYMPETEIGEYLHNYGVALLCANRPGEAMVKLRAAYRVNYEETTLEMISVASKILEWDLEVEIDKEPEMSILLNRTTTVNDREYSMPVQADSSSVRN